MPECLANDFSRKRAMLHLLVLAAFSAALWLPLLGHGFIHDDFVWLNQAANRPWGYEFTHPVGSVPLYSPLVMLTFRFDWAIWGFHPFPYGVENLLLHIANTFLLYGLVFLLWRSFAAAWWAAFGFALLYTANVWAMMWIATRGHLIVTLFFLMALCGAVFFVRSSRHRVLWGAVTLGLALASVLSKETGITLAIAIPVMLWFERCRSGRTLPMRAVVLFLGSLAGVVALYFVLRTHAGALSVAWSSRPSLYQYKVSMPLFVDNVSHYVGWTYGLEAILAIALAGSVWIRGQNFRIAAVTKSAAMLSLLIFAATLAPVVFMPGRSGIYSYLPGASASLLLGAAVQAQDTRHKARNRAVSWIPVLAVIAVYVTFASGQAKRWKLMAEDDAAVLRDISTQLPHPARGIHILLRYEQKSTEPRFHNGFATWGFSPALQLLYGDPTITGAVIVEGDPPPPDFGSAYAEFMFRDRRTTLVNVKETADAASVAPH